MIPLSEHFSLEEMVRSETAKKYVLDNTPDNEVVERLKRTAEMLERVRAALGNGAIVITSGYRSAAVNKAVGGSAKSAHCRGYAVDFVCSEFGRPLAVCNRIIEAGVPFDQLIHEFGRWTHISFDPRMRAAPLSIASAKQGYLPGIHPIAIA